MESFVIAVEHIVISHLNHNCWIPVTVPYEREGGSARGRLCPSVWRDQGVLGPLKTEERGRVCEYGAGCQSP